MPGWFDTPSEMPGALIEPLFITDPFEGSIADSPSGQQAIAGGLAQAVEQYFDPPAAGKNSEEGGRASTTRKRTIRGAGRLPEPGSVGARPSGQIHTRAREISAFCRTAALTPAARQVP